MSHQHSLLTNLEPSLGSEHALEITGLEPGLSIKFRPLYGRFRIHGLEAPPIVGRRRPLVVLGEYDRDAAQLIHLIADSNGYEVLATHDGAEVLHLAETSDPNLIVLNIRLAGSTGYDVIRTIRSNNSSLREKPILVMDVHRHKQDILAAFDAGADDYLVMPYDVPIMLNSWRRATGSVYRPAPLTAVQNDDAMVQQLALSYILDAKPEGVVSGLINILKSADPALQLPVRWALRRLGTLDALTALSLYKTCSLEPKKIR